ncbi:hypothetical protein OIE66_08335 [Nonomuraea sp. NBC_01738]|uniref:hypothetical protein n=1 Tax=Nonomuraea sp. NBC_01738 TaxID=2976003 RepID=UPI002E12B848|nr:hypothetical protein OIE66_08335 [Nonomuraea sp. NBC_01738]
MPASAGEATVAGWATETSGEAAGLDSDEARAADGAAIGRPSSSGPEGITRNSAAATAATAASTATPR